MYVQRVAGAIVGAFANLQPGIAEEALDDASPELVAFLNPAPTRLAQDIAAAKQYSKLAALQGMTPAQVQTWVAANVTTLAAAQDAITTLAIAVSVLSRRL